MMLTNKIHSLEKTIEELKQKIKCQQNIEHSLDSDELIPIWIGTVYEKRAWYGIFGFTSKIFACSLNVPIKQVNITYSHSNQKQCIYFLNARSRKS